MPFPEEIRDRLVAQNSAFVVNSTLFLGSKANLPTAANTPPGGFLVVRETGGTGSSRTQNDTATERPTAQLKAHAPTYLAARALLVKAYNALGGANGLYNITLNGVRYLSIVARQPPTDTGLDEVSRATLAFNIDAEKEPS